MDRGVGGEKAFTRASSCLLLRVDLVLCISLDTLLSSLASLPIQQVQTDILHVHSRSVGGECLESLAESYRVFHRAGGRRVRGSHKRGGRKEEERDITLRRAT